MSNNNINEKNQHISGNLGNEDAEILVEFTTGEQGSPAYWTK